MTKRRTRRQKETARHQFKNLVGNSGVEFSFKKLKSKPSVKRQIKKPKTPTSFKTNKKKLSKDKAKADNLASIKGNIRRSLVQAGIILGLELMLYFVLKF